MPILLIVIAAWQPKNQRLSSQVVTSSKYYLVTSAPRGCQELESPSFEKQITGILFQGISDWLTDKCTVDNIVNYLTFTVDNIVRANQLSWRQSVKDQAWRKQERSAGTIDRGLYSYSWRVLRMP